MCEGPRVLALGWGDALGEEALSGMPWNMREGLRRAGCRITLVSIGNLRNPRMSNVGGLTRRFGPLRRCRTGLQGLYGKTFGSRVRRNMERDAIEAARVADRAVDEHAPDVVFGPCMSRPIGYMQTQRPIVYASDATASLLVKNYEGYRKKGSAWRHAAIGFETAALARADRIAVASERVRQSAIEDHDASPHRVFVVPMGSNFSIPEGEIVDVPAEPPSTDDLRLLLVAADPERKRLNLCVGVVRELQRRGWNARLNYVGPFRRICKDRLVEWSGQLRLGDPGDRKTHIRLLRESHVGILPSKAEMFGIAPIESAAFGRPSVVSDAGGLPTVVTDGVTGRVVSGDSSEDVWCDAIEAMIHRPERYAEFSRCAHDRHETELNWDAWGQRVRGLIDQVV